MPFSALTQQDRPVAGEMLGKTFYWQNPESRCDTVGWRDVMPYLKINPEESQVYRLKNPSAMSMSLLKGLGYGVFTLSRWQCMSRGSIKVLAPGMRDGYGQQMIVSDAFWEVIDSSEIDGRKIKPEYAVKLRFSNAGHAEMNGKDNPSASAKQVLGYQDGLVLKFRNRGPQAQTAYRSILGVYVVAQKGKSSKQITGEIERVMDKMQLDMSYESPALALASGPWINDGGSK